MLQKIRENRIRDSRIRENRIKDNRIRDGRFLPFVLLTVLTLILLFLPVGFFLPGTGGWFFGSEGDWFSQHVAIAESLRQTMLSGHELLPQWIGLGGGSNSYDFAYYGLLRPDILISCLMPDVEMKYVIAGYAAFSVICSGWFCYGWLQKRGKTRWISFAGAVLFVSATCFYHAHHQIMFVNYMPFLVLALIGVDKAVERRKISLLAVSVVLIILHSFYYAPACICVIGIYALHRLMETGRLAGKNQWLTGLSRIIFAVALAIGMAMVILLPVAFDILSTVKDGGNAARKTLEVLDLSMNGLLYNSYGCGMTLVTLYTLLLAVRKKENRFLSIVLLAAMSVPAVSLVLNGFLYARAKILIPFVPLLVWVCIDTLQDLWEGRRRAEWIPLAFCLAVAIFSEWRVLILADGVILAIWIAAIRKQSAGNGKVHKGFWLILLVPICVSLGTNLSDSYLHDFYQDIGQKWGLKLREGYIHMEDERQNRIPADKISEFASDSDYRLEILADSFVNCNVLPDGTIQRTSMYSSISDGAYAKFYYDTMGNAISFNNRVALVAGENPFFHQLMGVRYVLAKKSQVSAGYQVRETYGDYVLAECKEVLPICYGTTELMSREMFDQLEFPDTLEALVTRTVVETEETKEQKTDRASEEKRVVEVSETEEFQGHFQKQDAETFFAEETPVEARLSCDGDAKNGSLKLREPLQNQIVVIRFHVNRKNGQEVVISVNGIKNKWSAASAPYPNQNEDFTYIFDSGACIEELEIKQSAGNYTVENLEIYTLNSAYLRRENVVKTSQESITKSKQEAISQESTTRSKQGTVSQRSAATQVFSGNLTMEQDGYFVTSYPYRAGYEILVDGAEAEPEVVNTTFLGCAVTAGSHRIEIRFTAPGYEAGRRISIMAVVIWGMVLLWEISRKGRKENGK